jgi:hypothetical protein
LRQPTTLRCGRERTSARSTIMRRVAELARDQASLRSA